MQCRQCSLRRTTCFCKGGPANRWKSSSLALACDYWWSVVCMRVTFLSPANLFVSSFPTIIAPRVPSFCPVLRSTKWSFVLCCASHFVLLLLFNLCFCGRSTEDLLPSFSFRLSLMCRLFPSLVAGSPPVRVEIPKTSLGYPLTQTQVHTLPPVSER